MSKAFPSTETKLQCESGTADSTLVPDTEHESGTVDTTVVPDTECSFIPPSSSSTNSWDFTTQEFPLFWCWRLGKVDGTDVAAELEVTHGFTANFRKSHVPKNLRPSWPSVL